MKCLLVWKFLFPLRLFYNFVFSRNSINCCFEADNEIFLCSQNVEEGTSPDSEKVLWAKISTFYCHFPVVPKQTKKQKTRLNSIRI